MRFRYVSRLVGCALLLLGPQLTCAQFEGVVESRNRTLDESGTAREYRITMVVKDNLLRVDMPASTAAPASSIIYRRDKELIWILNEAERTYFEVLMENGAEGRRPPSLAPEDRPVIRRTGRTKKILGYTAEQIILKNPDSETEIWATKELSNLASALRKGIGEKEMSYGAEWEAELAQLGMFPLRATTRMGGKVYESTEVVKIYRSRAPTGAFDVPAGYKRQGVNEMLQEQKK